jgi:diacylglycerol kinase family enzyme
MIDILQIDRVSRFTFLRLIGSYKAGTHLDGDKNANILKAFKARSIELTFDRDQNVCLDGEVMQMRKLTMELLPRALRFSLPKGTHICHPSYQAPKEATV